MVMFWLWASLAFFDIAWTIQDSFDQNYSKAAGSFLMAVFNGYWAIYNWKNREIL